MKSHKVLTTEIYGSIPILHSTVKCPYCRNTCELIDSKEIYGKSFGFIHICKPCDAYVGVHKHSPTYKPLGIPADASTRKCRAAAHAVFDALWMTARDPRDARHQAYILMQDLMDLPPAEAHIAMFNSAQCRLLICLLQDIKPFT